MSQKIISNFLLKKYLKMYSENSLTDKAYIQSSCASKEYQLVKKYTNIEFADMSNENFKIPQHHYKSNTKW